MTSDQSCPLCGGKTHKNSRKGTQYCDNIDCMLYMIPWFGYQIGILESQIARIKQEAKQEVFDELLEFTVKSDLPVDSKVIIRNYLEKRWLK